MLNLEEIVRQCHQKLLSLADEYDDSDTKLVAIKKLFGLFCKAEVSDDPKYFLLRHLDTFSTYANEMNADESMPLAFAVENPFQFSLALIYLEFLTIFDENICIDANQYLDILSCSSRWFDRLTSASLQMKNELKYYYQSCSLEEQEELFFKVESLEIKHILFLTTVSIEKFHENFAQEAIHAQHEKLGFEFRVLDKHPEVPFRKPTVVCLLSNNEEFYYFPANDLQKYQLLITDFLKECEMIFTIAIPWHEIVENSSLEDFVASNTINPPALLKGNDKYWIYGQTADDVYEFHEMNADIAAPYFSIEPPAEGLLCVEIYRKGYHIPWISYKPDYLIFSKIQEILEKQPKPTKPVLNYQISVQNLDNQILRKELIYVKRDEVLHTLSVSLKSCSGQDIYDLETGIIVHDEGSINTYFPDVLEFLRQEHLIPFLTHTQQMILKHFDDSKYYHQNFIHHHIPQKLQNVQQDFIKAYVLSTFWNFVGKSGLYAQVGQVFGVFNALKLLDIGIKYIYKLDLKPGDIQFGLSWYAKQDWETWIQYAGLGLLFSSLINRYVININPIFRIFNLLNILDSGLTLKDSVHNRHSRDFIKDVLSFGFSLLTNYHFNEKIIYMILIAQAYFLYQQHKNIQDAEESSKENIEAFSSTRIELQKQMEAFSVAEQQALFYLAQMEDIVESFHRTASIRDEDLIAKVERIEELVKLYLSFQKGCRTDYKEFLDQLPNSHKIEYEEKIYINLINDELERLDSSMYSMDEKFKCLCNAFESKKHQLENDDLFEFREMDNFLMSWEWLYQPSAMVSSGLVLASASLMSIYFMEFVLLTSFSALMLQLIVPVLLLTASVGIGFICYGLYELWQPEDLSVPPIALNTH